MVQVPDFRFAFSDEACQDESRAGAQVRRVDRRPFELRHAFYDSTASFNADLRPHALKFVDVHEAVFKDRLRNDARALANRRQGHELSLHIGREAGIGQGLDVGRTHGQMPDDPNAVDILDDLGPYFLQFRHDGLQMLRQSVFYEHVAAGHGRADHKGARFNSVGNNRMRRASQLLDAFDADDIRAGTADIGTHAVQIGRQVNDFRLFCRVFQDGLSFGQRSGHENVFRRADAGEIEVNLRPLQAVGNRRFDVAVFQVDDGAHRLEGLQMQVDRPCTDGTAAGPGKSSPGLCEPATAP